MIDLLRPDQTHPLRHLILRPEQDLSACRYKGDEEETTRHFGYFKNEEIVCIASLYLESRGNEQQSWRLRGMATHPDFRGRGYGREVLEVCCQYATLRDGVEIWCNARVSAVEFYLKFGFVNESKKPFDVPELGPHYLMSHRLK